MESSRPHPVGCLIYVRWAAPLLVRSVAGFGVSSQAKVVVGVRASRQVPGGTAAQRMREGGGPGRRDGCIDTGRGAACSQARSCFRAAMQVQGGCRLKFLEGFQFLGVFLKNRPRRLMRGRVKTVWLKSRGGENQGASELDFAANKTGPGALEETARHFLAGRTARCVRAGQGALSWRPSGFIAAA